jgi:hypothetical protein
MDPTESGVIESSGGDFDRIESNSGGPAGYDTYLSRCHSSVPSQLWRHDRIDRDKSKPHTHTFGTRPTSGMSL